MRTVPIEVTNLARDLRIQEQSAVVAQVQFRGNSRTLDSIEGTSLTARADVQSLSEGVHDVGLEIPRPLPHGVTAEAILPERITLRLRLFKESGVNPKPGP
jgi:YbbR domain-containing protein